MNLMTTHIANDHKGIDREAPHKHPFPKLLLSTCVSAFLVFKYIIYQNIVTLEKYMGINVVFVHSLFQNVH